MAQASYVIPSFLGGELSQFAQGRYDKPDYRISLQVCLNSFPVEAGPWTRRPGTMHAGTTLNGSPGRVIKFDFEQAQPYTMEFTDGFVRFRSGPDIIFPATIATPYNGGSWANLRAVQAETTDILLTSSIAPQALQVTTLPTDAAPAVFALAPAIFNDGPYLDAFTNGVQVVPSAVSGIISLALQFPAYSSAKAYAQGAFVTSASINYRSLVDQNVGHTPAASPTFWQATPAGAAINNGQGFLGGDVGRLVRLLSEPLLWNIAQAYVAGAIVTYNPSGIPGASTYWQALVNNTGNAPGSDLTNWQIVPQGAAVWTWGKITALTTAVDPALAGGVNIGTMTGDGGLAAAFDGVYSKISGFCAESSVTSPPLVPPSPGFPSGTQITLQAFVGKNYSAASDQKIEHATVYPSSDFGFAAGVYSVLFTSNIPFVSVLVRLNLRASASAPANPADGTLLGTSGTIANTTGPVTINSSDIATAWKYVWIELVSGFEIGGFKPALSYFCFNNIAQVSFFNPSGIGVTGNGVSVEILGPPLLRAAAISTWRLGAYSNTTGWPTCGLYFEGRIWLGGAISNRFDASVSNGLVGGTLNFAPTDQYGVVAANAGISYTLNSDSVNPMYWMKGDLQGIKIGTQAGEWLVQAPTSGPIAPNNIAARLVSNIGSANIEPRQTAHTLSFVKRYARKLIEYFSDANFNKLSGPNLAEKAEHIVATGIAEIAYTDAVNPVIWGRCNDGSLFGVTYKRDTLTTAAPPTFAGWHRHTLGSGRVIESLCSGPSVNGDLDALTMVTNDPATGIRHVEILTDTPNEVTPLASSWFLDDAVRPSSVTKVAETDDLPFGSVILGGLTHLEGKTVQVFAGGLDCGDPGESKAISDFVVTGGAVTIPFGDGLTSGPGRGLFTSAFIDTNPLIVVGFTYTSRGQPTRPVAQADTGARNGPGFGKLDRTHLYAIKVVNSKGLKIGTDFADLLPVQFKVGDQMLPTLSTFTGTHQSPLQDTYSLDRTLCWEVSRPFPATVTALGAFLATQDQ